MSTAVPLGNAIRVHNYRTQNESQRLTPAQRRRLRHKENHELATARKA